MWYDAFCCLRCIYLIGPTFQFAALSDCGSDSLTLRHSFSWLILSHVQSVLQLMQLK